MKNKLAKLGDAIASKNVNKKDARKKGAKV